VVAQLHGVTWCSCQLSLLKLMIDDIREQMFALLLCCSSFEHIANRGTTVQSRIDYKCHPAEMLQKLNPSLTRHCLAFFEY
jgi:hypothetical protein